MALTQADMDQFRKEGSDFAESVYSQWEWNGGDISPRQESAVRRSLKRGGWIPEDERQQALERPSEEPTEEQRAALDLVLRAVRDGEPVTGLIGPAGTGKTTMMKWLVYELQQAKVDCVVTAPTHPAAAVLRTKGLVASTIHKAAGLRPHDDGTAGYTSSGGPIALPRKGAVIIDEASMVDEELLNAVLLTVPEATIVLVGDSSQLPPVSDSHMFDAIMDTWGAPYGELTKVIRSGDEIADLLRSYRVDVWRGESWPAPRGSWLVWADREEVLLDFMIELPEPEQEMIVAYTNREVHEINRRGREAEWGELSRTSPYLPDERMISNSSVFDNDVVLLQNGQYVKVLKSREIEPDIWDVLVAPENQARDAPPVVNVTCCATDAAKERLLGNLEDEAKILQDGLYDMLGPAAESFKRSNKSRPALDKAMADLDSELRASIRLLDEDRRKAWQEFFRVKNSVADLRPRWCRTVHKAQGSQTRNVIILREGIDRADEDWRPLVYVAMSRAQEKITLI